MKIAYAMPPGRGDTDHLLSRLVGHLESRGLRVCGTVQANTDRPYDGPCDMDVRVLPEGPVIRISQDLGPGAQGCRLDSAALETAVGLVEARLERGADVLVINKFGKHEAEGRGFRAVIADALSRDIPVLVGLNELNRPAFETFSDGLAEHLVPELGRLEAWVLDQVARRSCVA